MEPFSGKVVEWRNKKIQGVYIPGLIPVLSYSSCVKSLIEVEVYGNYKKGTHNYDYLHGTTVRQKGLYLTTLKTSTNPKPY